VACYRVNVIHFFLPLICLCSSLFLSIKIIVLYLFRFFFFLSSLPVFNLCVPRLFPSFSVTYFFIRFPSDTFGSLFPAKFQAAMPVSHTSRHLPHSCPCLLRSRDLPFTKPDSDKQPSQVLLFNLPYISVHRGHLCRGRQVSQRVTCHIDSRDVGAARPMLRFILRLFNDTVQMYNNKPPLQLRN